MSVRATFKCTDPTHTVVYRKSGGRVCRTCATDYHRRYREEHREYLRAKANERQRKSRAATPAWIRYLWNKWGLTPEAYNEMLEKQGGVCAICGDPPTARRLCVDHDHQTGAIRKLLHNECNVAIGMLNDDPELVLKAYNYLKEHEDGESR